MASPWGVFGASVTVPAGGWRYAFSEQVLGRNSALLVSGTYSSVWTLAHDLDTAMDAIGGTFRISTYGGSNFGKLRISSTNRWTTVFPNCAAELLQTLGVSTQDCVSGTALTPTNRPRWAWFPGLITFGATNGEGLETDNGWVPEEAAIVTLAGSGASRCVGPSRQVHFRMLRFGWIGRTEREEQYRGPAMLERKGRTKKLCWYPDRDDCGPMKQPVQGDPEADNTDASCDYWLCTQVEPPKVERRPENPDWFQVTLLLNGEP